MKLTEWVWGGETAWMQKIVRSDPSAHSRSPPSLSKEWWKIFIHQTSAAGFILRSVKPATFGTSIQASYLCKKDKML